MRKKKIFFLLVMIGIMLSFFSAEAQNVLTKKCNLMQPGDSVTMQIVDYMDAGEAGENAVWNFNGIDCSGIYYIKYNTLDSSQFVGYDTQNTYTFSFDHNHLMLSNKESALQCMNYLQPQLLQVFPFQYNETFSKEYSGEGRYCGTHYERTFGTIQITADGQGTLILADNDTLSNTLRVYTINTASIRLNSDSCRNDSDNMKQVITERYQWFTRGFRYPVFETVTSSTYNNLNYVSTQQYAYCCPPSVQSEITDSINEEIRYRDILDRQNGKNPKDDNPKSDKKGDKCIFDYKLIQDGNQVVLTYDISENAHIHIIVVDIMGVVYCNIRQTNEAGNGYTIGIDGSGLRRGQYIIYMNVNGNIYNNKIQVK